MIRKFWGLYCFVLGCFLCNSVWAEENPDEYRDCVQYSIEEAIAATELYGNQVTFTFSGFMTRAEGDNSDCGIISYIDSPSSGGDGSNSNGGGSPSGNGGGSSGGNGGGSSGGSNGGTPSTPSQPSNPEPTPDSDGDSGAKEDDDSAFIPGGEGEAGEDELG